MPDLREQAPHPPLHAEADLLLSVAASAHDQSLASASTSDPPSRKRARATEARGSFPRKRAVAACEVCRLRKTKCDNQRPKCGRCVASRATCVFRDRESDYSAFDPASLALLDRLNYAIGLLENQSAHHANREVSDSPRPLVFPPGSSDIDPERARTSQHDAVPDILSSVALSMNQSNPEDDAGNAKDAGTTVTDARGVSARCSCTYVLDWPVFEGRIPPESANPRLVDSTSLDERQSPSCRSTAVVDSAHQRAMLSTKSATSILGGNILALVESFLRNVHTKNPIFDPGELAELAWSVAEDGFQWDSASCLVLIICALGTISMPWEAAIPRQRETSLADTQSYLQAETYYNASRKRLSLLDSSIRAIQCWFFAGVYEMYSIRPMSAWLSFNRACTMFQLRLHTWRGAGTPSFGSSEQRLYWSCLKSDCEMREEFNLPPSGLTQVEYLDVFPSPPSRAPDRHSLASASRGEWEPLDEKSWFYYLSEIAYRRITNRTITTLYGYSKEEWLSIDVEKLHRIVDELDKQIVQWWEHIPGSPALAFRPDADELHFMLWLNYVDLRERVWRPFLFIAVHRGLSESETAIVIPGARRCLNLCFAMIQDSRLKHRHHGLWLTIRCMFTKSLLVLAAVKSNRIEVRSDWRDHVHSFQEYLRYWEAEALDLSPMRCILAKLLEGFSSQ